MTFRLLFVLQIVAEFVFYFPKHSDLKNDSWTVRNFQYPFNKGVFCRLFTAP